jgi:hypothetical protein
VTSLFLKRASAPPGPTASGRTRTTTSSPMARWSGAFSSRRARASIRPSFGGFWSVFVTPATPGRDKRHPPRRAKRRWLSFVRRGISSRRVTAPAVHVHGQSQAENFLRRGNVISLSFIIYAAKGGGDPSPLTARPFPRWHSEGKRTN